MSKYELLYIVKNNMTEELKGQTFTQIEAMMTAKGAQIEKIDNLGVKRLAYPIEKLNDGAYVLVTFESETAVIAEITKQLNLDERVLRSMIIMRK